MKDYQTTVMVLAEEVGATMHYDRSMYLQDGYSNSEDMTVHMPPVTDSASYWVAMHELGHLAYRHGMVTKAPQLTMEAQAWDWALRHSPYELDQDGARTGAMGMSSYLNMYMPESEAYPSLYMTTLETYMKKAY